MKFKDKLNLATKKAFRDKKNIFLILTFIIGFLTIIAALTYKTYTKDDIENTIARDIGYRTIIVNYYGEDSYYDTSYGKNEEYNKIFNKVLEIDHVVEIYNFVYFTEGVSPLEYKDGIINFLYGSNNTIPQNIYGETINSNSTGVAICPLQFYPYSIDDYKTISEYIDGKTLLGTYITISEPIFKKENGKIIKTKETYNKKYKIVGLYDATQTDDGFSACYISAKDIKELHNTILLEANGERDFSTILAIVDDLKNVDTVINQLTEMGYKVETQSFIIYDDIEKINNICNTIMLIAITGIILLTLLFVKKINNMDLKNIGIEKAIGFNKKELCQISNIKIIILSSLSSTIGFILYSCIIFFLKIYFRKYLFFHQKPLNLNLTNILISFFIIIIIPLIINYILTSISTNKNVTKLLRRD